MEKTLKKNQPVVLVILDGWGIAPPSKGNPISLAKTPCFDFLSSHYYAVSLEASGLAVGLPWGEMGNSEVGHLNIGAGKVIYQTLPRIDLAVKDKTFFQNKVFNQAVDYAKKNNSAIHLMGLVSEGKVHSSLEHLYAILEILKQRRFKKVFIHAFLDGRDVPRDSALVFIKELQNYLKKIGFAKISSLSGRFYAMDRDNHWERIEPVYHLLTGGIGVNQCLDPLKAITESYKKNVFDEEFLPTVVMEAGKPLGKIENKDAVIFFNYRPDRARQLTEAFIAPDFKKFKRHKFLSELFFVTMTQYKKDLPVQVAFLPEEILYPLAYILSEAGLKQLHLAETEKYAHVTYFFNGGREKPYKGEDDILIPSPRVSSYAQKPEMSTIEVSKTAVQNILAQQYDFIVINFANPDMVSHTGDIKATIKAIETVDKALANVADATLAKNNILMVTADHGNAEELISLQTGKIDKEHSTNPVPFILVGEKWKRADAQPKEKFDISLLQPTGVLADIAPTILKMMKLKKPREMTGESLV